MRYIAISVLILLFAAAYFDNVDRERNKEQGSRFVEFLPEGSEVLLINGSYISFKYNGQCFLSFAAGERSSTLTKIDC